MKSTGIVRRLDDLGRIIIPKEICRTRGINGGDAMEIFVTDDCIVLKKHQPCCHNCGNGGTLYQLDVVTLCRKCVNVCAELVGDHHG